MDNLVPPLKMFVWQNVLTDHTSGLVVILARDLEEARQIAERDFEPYMVGQFFGEPYEVFTEPHGVYVYGGG